MNNELRRIKSPFGDITIRRYEERDIQFHEAYVYDSPKEFLESIGFDIINQRPRSELVEFLKGRISETKGTARPNALVAELDRRTVALVPLDLREYAEKVPRLHFHIFESELRGKGLGRPILQACIEEFAQMSGFTQFLIEPKASNEPMNKLMRKLGFRYIRDYLMPARAGVQEMVVSQYEISLEHKGWRPRAQ